MPFRALGPALLCCLGLACASEPRAARPVEGAQPKPEFRLHCRLEYPVGSGSHPRGLVLRDLDGDGRPELVGLGYAPGTLQVSSGYSAVMRELPAIRTLEVGDWAVGPAWLGDTSLVAFAPRAPSELVVVDARAVWAGKNAEAVRWRTPLERKARCLTTGDVDGDGRCEVLVTTVDDELIVFEAQDTSHKLQLFDEHASCLAALPGRAGIAVGFQGSRRLVLYVPTQAKGFQFEPGPAVQLSGLPREILACDIDGDGDDELAVALGDKSLWIFGAGKPGGVAAALSEKPIELEVASVPIDLAAAEFDGQPGNEIACLSLAGQEAQVFAWREGALRSLARVYAGQAPLALAIGDLDGDGRKDLALANDSALRWSVCFGLPGAGFDVAPETPCGRSPQSLAVGDLDGDGRKDVVALNALEGTLSVMLGTPGGLGSARMQMRTPRADELRLADVDGDGFLDALWLAKLEDRCVVRFGFGDGRGGIAERASVRPLEVAKVAGDLVVADLDGDGAPELLVSDPEGNLVHRFARRSAAKEDPRYEETAQLSIPGRPGPLALLDEHRVAVGTLGGVVIIDFSKDAQEVVPLAGEVRALCCADLDGDRSMDLALLVGPQGNENAGAVIPLIAKKGGGWQALEASATGLRPYRIAAADLDGDGRAEIVVSAQNSHQLNLWFSGADGIQRGPDLGVGTGPLGLALADLDGDGVVEILSANHFSDGVSLIRVR